MEILDLNAITLDPALQPRAEINRDVLHDDIQHLIDGVSLPPVTVFRTDAVLLLADGFANSSLVHPSILLTSRLSTTTCLALELREC